MPILAGWDRNTVKSIFNVTRDHVITAEPQILFGNYISLQLLVLVLESRKNQIMISQRDIDLTYQYT